MGFRLYINEWFHVPFGEVVLRAKCIDIEFESPVGPMFLFQTTDGNKFWVNRRELNN